LNKGCAVTVLDTLEYGQHSLFHLCARPQFDFIFGDARNEQVLAPLVRAADVIIPLAAVVGAVACERDPLRAKSLNVDAIRLLTRLRSPGQLIIYPNTNSGYGTKSAECYCTEETPLEPISLYGTTKCQAELELLQLPNVITLRLATVFGASPRPRLDLLVNHFVYAAATDGYLVLFEKDFKRNYIHVRDVADCFIHCMESAAHMSGRAYNAGLEDANLSKIELAEKVKQYLPKLFIHAAAIGSDPDKRNYIVSNARLREAGFVARRSLDDGIRELLIAYRLLGRHPLKNV
jgi:nucleoside-diphosphate-sugar epimerase